MILGPTEHRVARWLADRTARGRITLRMVDVATANRLERSEAYRITARLRILGLFGIENDRGGSRGGRRFWRTAIAHDGAQLDEQRHRDAWARVVAWARDRAQRLRNRLHHTRSGHVGATRAPTYERPADPPGGSLGILDRLIAGGLSPGLIAEFSEPSRGRRR